MKLYRVISVAEFDDLIDNWEFKTGPNTLEGKQFCYSLNEAMKFIEESEFLDGEQGIISFDIPDELSKKFHHSGDIDLTVFKNGVLTVYMEHFLILNEAFENLDLEEAIMTE